MPFDVMTSLQVRRRRRSTLFIKVARCAFNLLLLNNFDPTRRATIAGSHCLNKCQGASAESIQLPRDLELLESGHFLAILYTADPAGYTVHSSSLVAEYLDSASGIIGDRSYRHR